MIDELDQLRIENHLLKQAMIEADMNLRSALVWAGDDWGSIKSLKWSVQGACDAIREKDQMAKDFHELHAMLKGK